MNTNRAFLEKKSKQIRNRILDIAYRSGRGHLGGTFSVVDILVSLYYGLEIDFLTPVLIGKGHACLALYAILEDLGIISSRELDTFGQDGSIYNVQFDRRIPTILYNTGSLGNVVGIAAGLAYATTLKHSQEKCSDVYAIIGDGECAEGSIWESIQLAASLRLGNLSVVVDWNKLAVTCSVDDPYLEKKFQSFGACTERVNGHSFLDIISSLLPRSTSDRPRVVLADTVKGKGVSFMEGDAEWHHRVLKEADYLKAKGELR